MKSQSAMFFAAAALCMNAQADEPKTVVLKDGVTATVFYRAGTSTGYLRAIEPGANGKSVLIPGEVFAGVQLAKREDGKCVKIVDRLVRFEEVVVGDGKIQRPVTEHAEEPVACNT